MRNYSGYKSFQYLEQGADYKKFDLLDGFYIKTANPYKVELTESEEERVQELVEKEMFISAQDHPIILPKNMEELLEYVGEGRIWVSYEGIAASCFDAIFDTLMTGPFPMKGKSDSNWNKLIHALGMRLCDLSHQDFYVRAEKVDDIVNAYKNGKVAMVPGLEAITPIEKELDRIDVLYGLGIRIAGLGLFDSNQIASGAQEERDSGLTDFGKTVIERMNKIGMAIDLSHQSEQSVFDACECSRKPMFINHRGCRSLWDTKALKTDESLKALASNGGILGIFATPIGIHSSEHPEPSVEAVMDHFNHAVDVIGIDHVCYGGDTMYGDHAKLPRILAGHLDFNKALGKGENEKEGTQAWKVAEYTKGMENPTEASYNFLRGLVKNGYSNKEIKKVLHGNILRVLKDVW